MNTTYKERSEIAEFIIENRESFEERLLTEAVNVATKINDILNTGNIDLLENAQILVLYVVENKQKELIDFARKEGVAWAHHSLTLSFKLEWVHAIRRTLWHFLYQHDKLNGNPNYREEYYEQEKKINDGIDEFLNGFFISYSDYKDELIKSQRKLVEYLSVPIIPVSPTVAVFPLIGAIDSYRMQTIEEKVLMDISRLKIHTLIIDLSGITDMEEDIIFRFQKVLIGVSMMGGKSVISGLRPELVRKMIRTGISFDGLAETKGTLQQTLMKYLIAIPNV
jgi:rsbT co-antagonist protein RsbR